MAGLAGGPAGSCATHGAAADPAVIDGAATAALKPPSDGVGMAVWAIDVVAHGQTGSICTLRKAEHGAQEREEPVDDVHRGQHHVADKFKKDGVHGVPPNDHPERMA